MLASARYRYGNTGFSSASLGQRPCFPHFVRGDERCQNLAPPLPTVQETLQQRSCGCTGALGKLMYFKKHIT